MKTKTFKDHVVMITGASSGIGKALALKLADEGASLSLAARNTERLKKIAGECQKRGGNAIAAPTDLTEDQQCKKLIDQTIRQFGQIDMLINNAGFNLVSKFDELLNLELFHKVMDVNFNGLIRCTYHALPYLKITGGRIVNISSLGGKFALPYNTSYIASKFAVTGFSDALRMELKENRVSVTVIFPFWVVTEFHERMIDKKGTPRGEKGRAIYTEKMMTADKCADIIIKAAKQRKREVVMKPGSMAAWLKLLAPNLLDKITVERFFRKIVERTNQN